MEADYIMLEQFNHGWSNKQVNDFREMWKAGISVENIAKVFKRKPHEVISSRKTKSVSKNLWFGGIVMSKQLTIFDVEPVAVFNPEKAYIKRLDSKIRYTDIVVKIPINAKAIDELPKTTAPDERYELFEEYTLGIWRYKRVEDKEYDWERAETLCRCVRDEKQAIPIRLHLSLDQSFIPENILKYLC